MTVLLIDFNNMVHRARAGFGRGPHAITYTFLLMLRKTVEKFSPGKLYIVKEGRPQRRHDTFGEYKTNRSSAGDDFWRQHSEICEILAKMPVSIVRHPLRECDDTIAHLARVTHLDDECIIVSTDTDFIQLLSPESGRIRLWNPIKESWVSPCNYSYVDWKSLVGDGSDNIPGFKGVGGKTAEKLLANQQKLEEFLQQPGHRDKFLMNRDLISFHEIHDELDSFEDDTDWDATRARLTEMGFQSIVSDKSWNKYINTFSTLKE